jgi:tetratricopeptide (TPR) repeat protein
VKLDSDQQPPGPASPKQPASAKSSPETDRNLSWYAAREPLVVVVLSVVAVVFLFAVGALSRVYRGQLKQRGSTWYQRGRRDLEARHFQNAVTDFQVALSYSRDDYGYELSLAQALMALNRTEEARAYLISLWQRQPENGSVNLQLARIYAAKNDITQALRYYHNAIYAVWDSDPEGHQRSVRLELIKFLLNHRALNQAESELIAVGRDLPENPALHLQIADSFMRIPDYHRALEQYEEGVKLQHHNAEALAGAGRAALQLARFPIAERYLSEAVAANPTDAQTSDLLAMIKTVRKMDPYDIASIAQRDRAVLDDFNIAGERLNACVNAQGQNAPANSSVQQLYRQWMEMKTTLSERSLRQDPDNLNTAMNLVFSIEKQTSETCGTPTGSDLALLLIARRHEGG